MNDDEANAVDAQALGVLAILDAMHQRLAAQGCDQRALLRAVTVYLARVIRDGAIPGQQGLVLAGTQRMLGEVVMAGSAVAGHA